MIGVCGTAMATLAAMLKRKGLDVRGSDQDVYPPMSDFLAAEGISAQSGYKAEHITGDLDLVIVGNAISRGNPELEQVLDRKSGTARCLRRFESTFSGAPGRSLSRARTARRRRRR